MTPIPIDQRRNYIVLPTLEETIRYCAQYFIDIAVEAIKKKGSFYAALSGGSTPKAVYHLLAEQKFREQIDWSRVYLFWSDERCVAPSHIDSNYLNAMNAGLAKLPIPADQIFRMKGEMDAKEGAKDYEGLIKAILKDHPFDLVLLGMGEDGHTASLFPGTEGLKAKNERVIANYIPQMQSWRITFSLPFINQAKHIVFLVTGKSKEERVAEILKKNADFPSQQVGTSGQPALWILDRPAGNLIV